MKHCLLLPPPRELRFTQGFWKIPSDGVISLPAASWCNLATAQSLREHVSAAVRGPHWQIVRANAMLDRGPEIRVEPDASLSNPQAYRLKISATGVQIFASAGAGMFYGVQTLLQLLRQYHDRLPCMEVHDWPDFPRRAFYHDVSRGKVPRLETVLALVDDLAALKINEFQLYVENVFAFRRHPGMYDDTDPLTAEELLIIDAYCWERFIDFVPSLTSLGHFDKILRRPQYRRLAEAEPDALRQAGIATWSADPWTLCTTDPAAKQLLEEMVDEFVPNFSSPLFNICCDESWDLGKGRSRPEAERIGVGQMYINWVNYCRELAERHGRKIQLWGDIIINHQDLISQIPKDSTLLEWGYEADHPFAEHGRLFHDAGRAFYVCPGTSSWLTLAGRTQNALGNLRNAAQAGREHGASGYMITDWGDHGHQQMLSISLLPLAFGAAVAWNEAATQEKEFLKAAALHVFGDATLRVAGAVAQLGNLGLILDGGKKKTGNASPEFFLFREAWDSPERLNMVREVDVRRAGAALEKIVKTLESSRLERPGGPLIREELLFSARCIAHTLERTLLRKRMAGGAAAPPKEPRRLAAEARGLGDAFKRLWLLRNKPSRMRDVLAHFQRLEKEYAAAAKPAPRAKSASGKRPRNH